MKIKDIEFNFDFNDIDDLERFEQAHQVLVNTKHECHTQSELARSQCNAIQLFLDTVLGDGAYKKIVTRPTNVQDNLDALSLFVDAYADAADELNEKNRAHAKKYTKYMAVTRRK